MTTSISARTVLVTGGNSGIGQATALALSMAGARVILTSRSRNRAEAVASQIAAASGQAVTGLPLDLSSSAAINAFADDFLLRFDRLDVLINNAGMLVSTRRDSADGWELTWAANYLGPFSLTARLLPLLRQAKAARIVTTASDAHLRGRIDFDDFGMRDAYSGFTAYSRSKLGNVLFTAALARRLQGLGITANCFHPGVVATGFFRFVPVLGPMAQWLGRPFLRSPAKGAETAIFLASDTSMAAESGGYYFNRALSPVSALAADIALQERVWDLSVTQTGAKWDFA